jgi:hypothetical protein
MLISSCGVKENGYIPSEKSTGITFANEDKLVCDIRERLVRRQYNIVIEFDSGGDDLKEDNRILKELMNKACEETDEPCEGDYLAFQLGGYDAQSSCRKNNGRYIHTISIFPDYYTTVGQEQKTDECVREITEGFAFDEDAPDTEKIRRVYDHIYDNVEYDIIHKNNANYHLKSTAYGALINGHATCQGYAVTVYRLMREAGIDCRIITGTAYDDELGEEYHAWNIVCADGKYYSMDLTWDKRLGKRAEKLCCDADFYSHVPDEKYQENGFKEKYCLADSDIMF